MTSDELDMTERGRILQVVRDELSFPQVGRVITVWPHTGDEERPSNHEVDVAIPPGEPVQEPRRVPIQQPVGGAAYVPRVGDLVLVGYLRGNGDRPIVLGSVYADADRDRAPLAETGDVRVKRGSTYCEVAGDGSWVRMARKPGDLEPPTAKVEIDANGDVRIESDGDILLNGIPWDTHGHPYDGGISDDPVDD